MSLRPDDRSSRKRESSRNRDRSSTRDRDRSRSNVRATERAPERAPEAPKAPSPPSSTPYGYSAPPPGSFDEVTSPSYEVRSPVSAGAGRSEYFRQAPPGRTNTYPRPSTQASVPYPQDDHYDDRQDDYKDYARSGFVPRMPAMPDDDMADLAYGDVSSPRSPNGSRHQSYSSPYPPGRPEDPYPPQIPGYPRRPELPTGSSRSVSYTQDYSQSSRDIDIPYPPKPQYQSREPRHEDEDRPRDKLRDEARRTYSYDSYDRDAKVVERVPARDASDLKSSKSVRLSVDTRSGGLDAPRSPGLTARTDRLSVSGTRPDLSSNGGLPPPSPLLEAYHGTWQQLSPMPMAHRLDDDDELDNLPQLEAPKSRSSKDNSKDKLAQEVEKKKKKSVKVDDYEEDAQKISQALQKHKIDTEALSEIIPFLTHDQIMHVRREYKKLVKVQGKGVNLAKHLKTKLTGNFGKAVYVTVLGRWESEGYWANFWWQSHTSRRELLIESLMGRTNREILEIKEEFRDKRYADDLVKCMEKELKMDKFRVAVLMALEGRRQEEQDVYPQEYRNRDVETLHKALTAKQGGESVMLEVIVRRSDAHLREVMKMYDRMFGDNFPRAALKKSSNLVGEVIAHILNGVINKPVRDALLLRHAIKDIAEKNKDDELRYELLISRLVRLHWDRPHLLKVKREYFEKYKVHLEDDIQNSTSGDFTDFMWNLCDTDRKQQY